MEEGISEEAWNNWCSNCEEGEFVPEERIIWNDENKICLNFLTPLGKGVSGSVFVVKITESEKYPQLVSNILALKVFKKDENSIAQGNNEILIYHLCNRSFNTSRNILFPAFVGSFKVKGHLCFLMEVGGPTLLHCLGMRNYRGMPLHAIRVILKHILSALAEMENKGLVHGDIKPENIIFSMRKYGQLKTFQQYKENLSNISKTVIRDEYEAPNSLDIELIDWSSSSIGYNQQAQYMQSRFYRAPEILLRATYGPAVDVWSTACIAVELFIGKPLFPGKDEVEVLQMIQRKFGPVPKSLLKNIAHDSVAVNGDEWRDFGIYEPGCFEAFIKEECKRDDPEVLLFINFMRMMLQVNPDARITASSALLHPFISGNTSRSAGRRKSSFIIQTDTMHPVVHRRRRTNKEMP